MKGITATIFTSIARVRSTVTSRGRASYQAVRAAMAASADAQASCVSAGDDTGDHQRIEADHGGCEASLGRSPVRASRALPPRPRWQSSTTQRAP